MKKFYVVKSFEMKKDVNGDFISEEINLDEVKKGLRAAYPDTVISDPLSKVFKEDVIEFLFECSKKKPKTDTPSLQYLPTYNLK